MNRYAEILRKARAPIKKPQKARLPQAPSKLEMELQCQVQLAGLGDQLETEFKLISGRRFRWDVAFPAHRLLVEIQGGIWSVGGHSTGTGITRDCEKNNLAVLAGYRCLMVTGEHIRTGQALKWIRQALGVI